MDEGKEMDREIERERNGEKGNGTLQLNNQSLYLKRRDNTVKLDGFEFVCCLNYFLPGHMKVINYICV